MSQKAANTDKMNVLHDKLADIFTRVLKNYESKLNFAEDLDPEVLTEELLTALGTEPSPAMLSTIAKFLKDNEISYDDGAVEDLSAVQEQLANRQKDRGKLATLTTLRAVENG